MKRDLNPLMDALGHQFRHPELLEQALTHRSFGTAHNQRLEFLGDAILGAIISEELYRQQPNADEGSLSRMRSSLIRGETLSKLARNKKLMDYLRLGPGERSPGDSSLADTVEAIIAAIYLDSDRNTCRDCVISWYHEIIDDFSQIRAVKDAKTALQEWLQHKKLPLPQYDLLDTSTENPKRFTVICTVAKLSYRSEGVGSSRRKAEQIAAKHFLEQLREDN